MLCSLVLFVAILEFSLPFEVLFYTMDDETYKVLTLNYHVSECRFNILLLIVPKLLIQEEMWCVGINSKNVQYTYHPL